ncbi:hypothetical protein GF354_05630 [Candidatus Peregrinibacteria bacterium]|nr:hypothetical protein [Candidatus Peregrinibacteria bacterium]
MDSLDKKVSYKVLKKRQKTYIRAYAALCTLLLITMGFYSYTKWVQYSLVREGIKTNNEYISLLKTKVANESSEYDTQKPIFDETDKEVSERLDSIFPENDAYTELTKQLDTFEEELNRANDPFEVASLDYQTVEEYDKYSILPLQMTIRASAENFTKFLHRIENSGSLSEPIRLMDISSIRLSFSEGDEENQKLINFSVLLNAYFQKQ